MQLALKYAGVGTSDKSLVVYLDVEVGSVLYAHSVRVPWLSLADHEILVHVDRAVRAKLMAAWEGPGELDDRLPGID